MLYIEFESRRIKRGLFIETMETIITKGVETSSASGKVI